MEVLTAHLR